MDQSETPSKNTTRKRCPNGTRWVKEANRCMTNEEKTAFMNNLKEEKKEKKRILLEQETQRKTRKKRSPLKTTVLTEPVQESVQEPVQEPVQETDQESVQEPVQEPENVDMYNTHLDISPEMEKEQHQE